MKFVVQDFKARVVEDSPRLTFFGADCPEKIYEFYTNVVEADSGYESEKEHVAVICLNTRLSVTGWHMVSTGTLSECTCHPREIFRPALLDALMRLYYAITIPPATQAHPKLTRTLHVASGKLRKCSKSLSSIT